MGSETQENPAGEQKLERYGVWVKVEPRTVAESPGPEGSFELTDLESSRGAVASRQPSAESTLTLEEEKLLDELDTELGSSESAAGPSIPDEEPILTEDEQLPDISEVAEAENAEPVELEPVSDEDLPELEEEPEPVASEQLGEASEVEVPLSDAGAGRERFEDLDELESELASTTATGPQPQPGSSEVLARIEDELRSIRADLTQLRSELSGMRKPGPEPGVAAPPATGEAQSGFFDEDEDETIALTGDELDNILNTAEITEEAAEAASVEESPELAEISLETPQEGLQESALELESAEIPLETGTAAAEEELPAELDLEELSAETSTPEPGASSSDGLPAIDLEGVPEIETTDQGIEPTKEVGDLETLDLEEEVSDVESLEPMGSKEPAESTLELAADVGLDTFSTGEQGLETAEAVPSVDELEIGELEAIPEEAAAAEGEQKEIEIPFESEPSELAAPEAVAPTEEVVEVEEVSAAPTPAAARAPKEGAAAIPDDLKDEIRTVLKYMDHLLEALPDEKIQEFAKSDYFVMYKKLFEDLGLGE